ncbi:hypothetical protein DCS_08274 [Drechmeria coniospora]|uniref:Uncharacterized protein n=1 Tax=Drechmeria coniospora TaxID=98403 RepID=A0A151GGU3_DRECN|nr:hypothetical protein DCS_08274 [Drechmeria coniospora]KYK56304.1 hypothetical protein DCS_08274 [Drechmeria coniospora]
MIQRGTECSGSPSTCASVSKCPEPQVLRRREHKHRAAPPPIASTSTAQAHPRHRHIHGTGTSPAQAPPQHKHTRLQQVQYRLRLPARLVADPSLGRSVRPVFVVVRPRRLGARPRAVIVAAALHKLLDDAAQDVEHLPVEQHGLVPSVVGHGVDEEAAEGQERVLRDAERTFGREAAVVGPDQLLLMPQHPVHRGADRLEVASEAEEDGRVLGSVERRVDDVPDADPHVGDEAVEDVVDAHVPEIVGVDVREEVLRRPHDAEQELLGRIRPVEEAGRGDGGEEEGAGGSHGGVDAVAMLRGEMFGRRDVWTAKCFDGEMFGPRESGPRRRRRFHLLCHGTFRRRPGRVFLPTAPSLVPGNTV